MKVISRCVTGAGMVILCFCGIAWSDHPIDKTPTRKLPSAYRAETPIQSQLPGKVQSNTLVADSSMPGIDPGQIFINPSGSAKTDTLYIQNIGNADLTVDSIRDRSSATWLVINNGADGFTIPEAGPDYPVVFTVNESSPVILSDGVYYDTFRIYNNSQNSP